MKKLDVKNLSIKYHYGALAIRKASFSVPSGSIYTVLGEEESGKTSLIKGMVGLSPVVEGEILLDGEDLLKVPLKDRNVCVIYEDGGFFLNKTARYNLTYNLRIRKVDRKVVEETAIFNLNRVGFPMDKLDVKVKKLNVEEKFLLTLARAYARRAEIYLIDNPLKKLGDKREEYYPILKTFLTEKSQDGIVIYATNSGDECRDIGGECSVLNYGVTLQRGNITDICDSPASIEIVKKLLTGYELVEGKIEKDEKIYFTSDDGTVELDEKKLLSEIFVGKECYCLIRNGRTFLYDKRSERMIYTN